MTAAPQGTARPRIGWIDTARGLAVLLVVLLHAYLAAREQGGFPHLLGMVNIWLGSIRLPVLFLVSGFLSAGLLCRPLPEVARRRIWPLLWVMAVWTLVGSGVNLIVPLYPWDEASATGIAVMLWTPQGNLWFLYALILYTLMGHAVVRAHGVWRWALLAAFLTGLAAYMALRDAYFVRNFVQFYPFFMAGLLLRGRLHELVRTGRRVGLLLGMTLAGLLALHMAVLPQMTERALEAGFGAALGIALAELLQHALPVKAALDAAGRNALPIFVGHQPFLALLYALVRPVGADPVLEWLALFGGAVALSLCAARFGPGWLYRIPSRRPSIKAQGDCQPRPFAE